MLKNRNYKAGNGFTLIELMIAIAIVGLLASIAYPSYQDSVRKTRRGDGKGPLLQMAAQQERWYFQNRQYNHTIATLYGTAASPEGHYTLSITDDPCEDTSCYTLIATATGSQTKDESCAVMSLDSTGGRSSQDKNGDPSTGCW